MTPLPFQPLPLHQKQNKKPKKNPQQQTNKPISVLVYEFFSIGWVFYVVKYHLSILIIPEFNSGGGGGGGLSCINAMTFSSSFIKISFIV